MTTGPHAEVFPRPPTPREAEILDFMLGVDDPRVEPLREQRKSLVVTGLCGCGCASIHLAVDRGRHGPAAICRQPIAADVRRTTAVDAERTNVCGILLFLDEGWLSVLEICWVETPAAEFPPATSFRGPEVTCERDEAALLALARHPRGRAPAILDRGIVAVRRLVDRWPTP